MNRLWLGQVSLAPAQRWTPRVVRSHALSGSRPSLGAVTSLTDATFS